MFRSGSLPLSSPAMSSFFWVLPSLWRCGLRSGSSRYCSASSARRCRCSTSGHIWLRWPSPSRSERFPRPMPMWSESTLWPRGLPILLFGSRRCARFGSSTAVEPEMAGQLVFPFGVEPALGREDFILAPCNEQAVQFIKRWPDWPARTAAIYGPAHCGKTHLAAIWQSMTNAQTVPARNLGPERVPTMATGSGTAIVIEDVDSQEPREDRDRVLLALLERP